MTVDELRGAIYELRRDVQFRIDCQAVAEDKLEKAKYQGFFDGYKYNAYEETWIKKD